MDVPKSLDEAVERRKRAALREAAKKGHRINNWQLDGQGWTGTCVNRKCTAHLLASNTVNGGIAGATAYSTKCPHKG